MKKVIVIGGGPAGMMAAGQAALRGNSVTLIEKMNKVGRKLYITGKGRCNVTNAVDPEGLIANTPGNPYFLYSAFYTFNSNSTMEFFEKLGVPVKVERGNRVFPKSEKSNDIVKAMESFVKNSGCKIMYETEVKDIITDDNKVTGVKLKDNRILYCDSVIVATGGLSYPMTGSTGDGYKFAEKCGHTIIKCYPSLVPLRAKEKWISDLMGLSLKNISIKVTIDNKDIYSDFGEMMFTHFGVTGPVILSASRYINDRMIENPKLHIDLKPALNNRELDLRLLKDFQKYLNKDFKNSLDDLLPQKLIPVIIRLSGIYPEKKVNSVTKEERARLLELIKNLTINITDTTGYDEAVVTMGGISTDEIEPSTMKSKIINGLYFAGEVIDVDSFTGGFNLQIAFSTGYLAGTNC